MPTIMTHALVGATAGAVTRWARRPPLFWALAGGLAMLPDVDVLGRPLGVPYGSMWSHRGVAHSMLAALVAALLAGTTAARRLGIRRARLVAFLFVAMASHGLLDTLTYGAPGPALLAPFSLHRYTASWQPLVATPIGLRFFSRRGLEAFVSELRWIWGPALAVAGTTALVRSRTERF